MNSGIYAILNTFNDKYYIGSATDFKYRWKLHINRLRQGDHHTPHLQNAWNKQWGFGFIFVVLEYVDIENLEEREQFWINELDACNREKGYNSRLIARSCLGMKRSEEAKLKMSLSQKGKKLSEEHIKALRGRKHSEETRKKISIAHKGKIPTKTQLAGLEFGRKNKSQETIEKIKNKTKGQKRSKEQRMKMSDGIWNKKTNGNYDVIAIVS